MKTIRDLPLSDVSAQTVGDAFLAISGTGPRSQYTDRITFPMIKSLFTDDLANRLTDLEAHINVDGISVDVINRLAQLESALLGGGGGINALVQQAIDNLSASISTEVNLRVTADAAEATTRTQLLAQLQTSLDTVSASVTTEQGARVDAISAEAFSRQTLQTTLQNNIDTVSASVVSERQARVDAVSAEASIRDSIATELRGSKASVDQLATAVSTQNDARAALITTIDARFAGTTGTALSASITDNATVAANATSAVATRATTLEAQFAGTQGSNLLSRIATVENVTTNGTFAQASRVSTLEARTTTTFPNSVINGNFQSGGRAWNNYSGIPNYSTGTGWVGTYMSFNGADAALIYQDVPINAGITYYISGEGDADVSSYINFEYLTASKSGMNAYSEAVYLNGAGFTRRGNANGTLAPAGAIWARVYLNKTAGGSVAFFTRIALQANGWTVWRDDTTQGDTLARISTVENVTTNGTFATATRASVLEAQFAGTQGSNLLSRIQNAETAYSDGRFASATRASNLEAQMNGTLGSNLNSRIYTLEVVTTNGTFATANRADLLEAQFRGDAGSNLLSRIQNAETAYSDGRFASASSVNTVQAQLNQGLDSPLYATVRQVSQATINAQGTATDARNRTNAFWGITADAGNGRAQITAYADGYGGVVDIVGDVRIHGSLTIDGTVSSPKLSNYAATQQWGAVLGSRLTGTDGSYDYQQCCGIYFVLSYDADVTLIATGAHAYNGYAPAFEFHIQIDSNYYSGVAGGAGTDTVVTLAASTTIRLPQGGHSAWIAWKANGSGVQLAEAGLSIFASYK